MQKVFYLCLCLAFIICGCNEENIETNPEPVSISIISATAESAAAVLSIQIESGDIDNYDSWGVTYRKKNDMSQSTEYTISSRPSFEKTDVRIEGLDGNTLYYFWAWADGKNVDRVLTSSAVSVTTQKSYDPNRLSGKVIGSQYSVDNSGNKSTSVNGKDNVFDGDYDTFFASYDASYSWVGLDLGEKYVINKIGYSPRINHEIMMELAIIEGANEPDFSDAIPIYMIKKHKSSREMHYATIECSRGFRYVRYVSPCNSHCYLAELEFYGEAGEGNDSQMYQLTNLPTVVINTEGSQDITSKENELSSVVYIISEGGKSLLATEDTGVRGRGNASWSFPKKPYRLKFASKQSPLGAPASAKKWTLLSNYGDKTLMRNMLAFETSRRVGQSYTPFCHPVDVIVNGEYRGCYQLCDQVEAASGRVEAKKGYLIEIDAYASGEEVWFQSKKGAPVTIKHPDEDDITSDQKEFIKDYFNLMEAAVFASDFKDENEGYRKYLDLDSFLKNFIIGEFGGNTDTFWSVYMYKDSGDGKLYTGPAWDYDLGFENDNRTYPINSLNDYIYFTKGSSASQSVKDLVTRIVKEDPKAKERLIEIWEKACSEGNLKNLVEYVNESEILLEESQQLNFKRWPILNQKVHQNFQALGSYKAEVQTVRSYINSRLDVFDQLIRK